MGDQSWSEWVKLGPQLGCSADASQIRADRAPNRARFRPDRLNMTEPDHLPSESSYVFWSSRHNIGRLESPLAERVSTLANPGQLAVETCWMILPKFGRTEEVASRATWSWWQGGNQCSSGVVAISEFRPVLVLFPEPLHVGHPQHHRSRLKTGVRMDFPWPGCSTNAQKMARGGIFPAHLDPWERSNSVQTRNRKVPGRFKTVLRVSPRPLSEFFLHLVWTVWGTFCDPFPRVETS